MSFWNGPLRINLPALGVLFLLVAGAAGCAPGPPGAPTGADPEQADRLRVVAPVSAPTAMAVTANPHATRAAVEVMKAGGNAMDAAVAAQFVLNVVEPQSSGIGGGGFLVAYLSRSRRVVAIDGREELPAGTRLADFLDPHGKPLPFFPDRITGGLAVGVPGLLKMLELALERYGTWPLSRATRHPPGGRRVPCLPPPRRVPAAPREAPRALSGHPGGVFLPRRPDFGTRDVAAPA